MPKSPSTKRGESASLQIGRVPATLRGRVWYFCYYEHGRRHQPLVGADRDLVRKTAAEINARLEVGVQSTLGLSRSPFPNSVNAGCSTMCPYFSKAPLLRPVRTSTRRPHDETT